MKELEQIHHALLLNDSMLCCALCATVFRYPDMLEVGRMEGAGETDAEESAHESESHFAACVFHS